MNRETWGFVIVLAILVALFIVAYWPSCTWCMKIARTWRRADDGHRYPLCQHCVKRFDYNVRRRDRERTLRELEREAFGE